MKVRIQVIVESDQGETQCVEDVAQFERGALQPDALGLTLAEAKALLQGVQRTMVSEQTTAYLDAQHPCPACGTPRRCKGHHQLVYRTVFGKLTLPSPRWYACRCQTTERRSFSPLADLLPERTAPELLYLEAKFAALMSYGVTVDVWGRSCRLAPSSMPPRCSGISSGWPSGSNTSWARSRRCSSRGVQPSGKTYQHPMRPSPWAWMAGMCMRGMSGAARLGGLK